jgi:transposase
VLAAGIAELRELETAGGRLLILGGGVVPVLAIRTLQSDNFAHYDLLLTWPATSAGKQLVSMED